MVFKRRRTADFSILEITIHPRKTEGGWNTDEPVGFIREGGHDRANRTARPFSEREENMVRRITEALKEYGCRGVYLNRKLRTKH